MPEKKKPDRNSIEIFIYPKFVREDKFGSFIPYSFNEILSTLLHDEYQNLYCSVDKEKGIMRFTVRNAKTNHLYFSMRMKQDETSPEELKPSVEENNDSEPEYVEVVDEAYFDSIEATFDNVPEIAFPLIDSAKKSLGKIEKMLYSAPAFIDAVKAAVPDVALQAVLTDEQKKQIAKGALKLMTKKDGSLMANLVNTETNKIAATIPLKSVQMAPELSQAMTNFSTQMQMAQIAEQIQVVQLAVEEVRQGQEHDRLATAYSCQQKFLQAMQIKNPQLRSMVLVQLAAAAEDSRNLLMLSQKSNVNFIAKQPESFFEKVLNGAPTDKIDERMGEIRDSLCAVNMVSFAEAMAYQELGENEVARQSLSYFADFVSETYLKVPGLLERLDLMDSSPENYWSKTLPDIEQKVNALPRAEETLLIGENYDEE